MDGTILSEDYISNADLTMPLHVDNQVRESDKNTRKHNTQESKEVSPFQAGDHKAARNRQGSIITKITTRIHKRSTALERSEKVTDLTVPT